ncbi:MULTISPECIES: hypothetical protein [unclassified Lentimicrobium]|uniref:hypothetical protein n=1 Tax=unclassified Lentimicrobium TaxID=2677434 RepID=UPI0015532D25|nr:MULTISPECIES: hypothetical protein [unclassified Lentimicrobium]NPD46030.1 hypothetical protein [Lentimicrobium sp. S6]NPD85230.1 hypothetical protein [Lentimicrobium sp. L6]
MKKLILIALLFTGLSTYSQVELSPMVGYFFGGKSNFYEGSLKIKDNINYGLHLGFDAGGHSMLELSYAVSSSDAQWRPNFSYIDLLPSREFDIQTHMFLIGGTKGVELSNPQLIGFGTFKAGAVYYNATNGDITDVWRFMINLGAGIKYYFTDKVGIKFQGNMYMPMYFNGGGIYCGIGSGGSNCGASVSSTVVIFQGDLTAGLIFKLGQ